MMYSYSIIDEIDHPPQKKKKNKIINKFFEKKKKCDEDDDERREINRLTDYRRNYYLCEPISFLVFCICNTIICIFFFWNLDLSRLLLYNY